MVRRRSSGLFETLAKAVFHTGTTVHRRNDWLGRPVTTVRHHDTGKTKTYTHGAGFFGHTTRTVTRQNGAVTERGTLRRNFLGTPVERAARTDGSNETVIRQYGRGFSGKAVRTTVKDQAGRILGTGNAAPGLGGGTRTQFSRVQSCHHCGTPVSSGDGHYRCPCGRVWGRR